MNEKEELEYIWGRISNSVDRLMACFDGLTEEQVNWKPLDNASTLYFLAAHTLSAVNNNVLSTVCGKNVSRTRDAEWLALGKSPAPLIKAWTDMKGEITTAMAGLPANAVAQSYPHPKRGSIPGREVLISTVRHAGEHMAHAELTRDLVKARG
ncbi:MAG: DinB family protein [SAR202 cluster bacterium]|nr:DinB family protein [SAR202 cluster bacterium]